MEKTIPGADTKILDPALRELIASSSDDEQAILRSILVAGVDQGWFCRAESEDLLNPSPGEIENLLEVVGKRPDVDPSDADPWDDQGPPPAPISGDEPGWVILSQRCDLIRAYRQEPLVEVARARLLTEAGDARTARLNSPRLVAFAEGPDKAAWAADLRQRAVIPKNRLLNQPDLIQPINGDRRRKQFRLRLGQRYWRDPVPTDLVESLQRPLIRVIGRSPSRAAFAERFAALLGLRTEQGTVLVVAVIAPDADAEQAEQDWQEIMALLEEHEPEAARLIEDDESGVYDVDDLSLGAWLDSFKFDLDEVTYGKKASSEQADPLT